MRNCAEGKTGISTEISTQPIFRAKNGSRKTGSRIERSVVQGASGFADRGAEGHQRELGEFEMLFAERDSDDGDAEHYAQDGVLQRERQTGKDEPEDIEKQFHHSSAVGDLFAEGKKTESRELEALHADRDSHDRDAPKASHKTPA